MDKDRDNKEKGAKIYEYGLHISSIGGLYMLLDTLGYLNVINISIFGSSELWWIWVIFLSILTLRLYILDVLKRKASDRGLLLTEYTDLLRRKRRF